jgi:hypothetical protein
MFNNAYAIEVGYAVSATAVLLGLLWKIRNAIIDHRVSRYAANPRVARALTWWRLYGALWHLVLVVILTVIAYLTMFTAPPNQLGHFWDSSQLTLWRFLFELMIIAHGMMIYAVNHAHAYVRSEVTEGQS